MQSWPKTDFHLHATFHRLGTPQAEMTVPNIVQRCEALGYEAIGIVEHLNLTPKHPLHCLEELVASFRQTRSTIKLCVGAELDIFRDALPLDEARALKARLGLDYYLGSVHDSVTAIADLDAYIAAYHRKLMFIVCEVDFVDAIAHPWTFGHSLARRGIIPRWRFGDIPAAMLVELARAAATHGKAIEINRNATADLADPAYRAFVGLLRDLGVRLAIGSDAHYMKDVGGTTAQEALLQEMHVPPQQIWLPGQ